MRDLKATCDSERGRKRRGIPRRLRRRRREHRRLARRKRLRFSCFFLPYHPARDGVIARCMFLPSASRDLEKEIEERERDVGVEKERVEKAKKSEEKKR